MHSEWQLQEAKSNLSQLIRQAATGTAQVVTLHGKPAAVVVSAEEYARLTRSHQGPLSSALLRSDIGLEEDVFSRDRDSGRDVPL
jgi:prevent-host-death family protein